MENSGFVYGSVTYERTTWYIPSGLVGNDSENVDSILSYLNSPSHLGLVGYSLLAEANLPTYGQFDLFQPPSAPLPVQRAPAPAPATEGAPMPAHGRAQAPVAEDIRVPAPGRAGAQVTEAVEVIDDEIAIISPSMFAEAEARKKARRDGDVAEEKQQVLQAAPPSEEFALSCPICIDKLTEPTATKCGHIFCKECIEQALAVQNKCPTCRRKLRGKATFRVYLPEQN